MKHIFKMAAVVALALTFFAGCSYPDDSSDGGSSSGSNSGGGSSSGSNNSGNTNNTTVEKAIMVTVGDSSSHTISLNGQHWYSFLGTGETVNFETTGKVDTYMEIWDKHSGAECECGLPTSDDNSGEGQNALVSLKTTAGTTYFIRITPKNSTDGPYDLIVKASTINTRTRPIPVADGYSSSNTISTSGEHWFSFQGTGQTVTLEAKSNVVTADIDIYIGENTSSTFSAKNKISFTTISGTTYYIKITGNSGSYIFNMSNGGGDGSSPSYAIPVAVGDYSSHTISLNGKHWYSFLGTGETMIFETTGKVDTYMEIWDKHSGAECECGLPTSDDNSGEGQNALVSLKTTAGTTYFIRITPKNSTDGPYDLIVKASTINTRTRPIPVADGYSSSNTISTSGEHWFSFQGTGQTVTLEAKSNVVTADIDIYIGENTSSTFSAKNKISFTTISGTTYYIKITGNSGSYIFNMSNGGGDGSSPSYAIPVAVGDYSSHTISLNGKHWYSFLGTGETMIFETTGKVDTYMEIWDKHSGAECECGLPTSDDNSGEGQNALISLKTTAGITYFIRITPKNSTDGAYTLIVR